VKLGFWPRTSGNGSVNNATEGVNTECTFIRYHILWYTLQIVMAAPVDDADRLLHIKISDTDRLQADRDILSAFSSCAKRLPEAATEWDVSGLMLEGQQVQRGTVVVWLNLAYQSTHGAPYEDTPPGSSLHFCMRRFTSLAQLLAFADAVGSSRGLLLSLDRQSAPLAADVQLGERPVFIASDACCFHRPNERRLTWYPSPTYTSGNYQRSIQAESDGEDEAAVQQLAQQIESLLYLAYKLSLVNIQERVLTFIFNNSFSSDSVLRGKVLLEWVLSERVLATEAGAKASKLALASALSTKRVTLMDPAYRNSLDSLLGPVTSEPASEEPVVRFKAECQRDFLGFKKGQEVQVEFDPLCSGYINLKATPVFGGEWREDLHVDTSRDLRCRLLVGEPVSRS